MEPQRLTVDMQAAVEPAADSAVVVAAASMVEAVAATLVVADTGNNIGGLQSYPQMAAELSSKARLLRQTGLVLMARDGSPLRVLNLFPPTQPDDRQSVRRRQDAPAFLLRPPWLPFDSGQSRDRSMNEAACRVHRDPALPA